MLNSTLPVSALEYPERHHLNSADGWMGLGNLAEAKSEVERIPLLRWYEQEVFLVRWRIFARGERWEDAQRIAGIMAKTAPGNALGWICYSYGLFQLKRPLEAWFALMPRAREFPSVSAIPYMLACYSWHLGNRSEAGKWLAKSAALGGPRELKPGAFDPVDLLACADSGRQPAVPAVTPPSTTGRAHFTE